VTPRPGGERSLPPLSLPERIAVLETLIGERQASSERQGGRMGDIEERVAKLELFMAKEEAREEIAREAREEARWATLLSKLGVGTGAAGTAYALWQLLGGG
jgi:K+/H+ antiporter YhaU regulatory subunit KhtT